MIGIALVYIGVLLLGMACVAAVADWTYRRSEKRQDRMLRDRARRELRLKTWQAITKEEQR